MDEIWLAGWLVGWRAHNRQNNLRARALWASSCIKSALDLHWVEGERRRWGRGFEICFVFSPTEENLCTTRYCTNSPIHTAQYQGYLQLWGRGGGTRGARSYFLMLPSAIGAPQIAKECEVKI
jgi:hypothetical protein